MNEPDTVAAGVRVRFSLRQIIAATTAVCAGFALCLVLQSPPVGSNGLLLAVLPALVLAAALWFCASDPTARLGTYAVVASLLALQFYGSYFGQSDWLFGHTHGPPQLVIATCWASTMGVLTGIFWLLNRLRPGTSASDSATNSQKPSRRGWLGTIVIVPLTLLSGVLGLASFGTLPHATRRMDEYLKRRQVRAEWAAASRARAGDLRPEPPELHFRPSCLQLSSSDS
jgi:hypothetical protein